MKRTGRRIMLRSELPEDALRDCARVTLIGRGAVLIEGQHGVIEMGEGCIRLTTSDGVLSVWGKQLRLGEVSLDAAVIHGAPVETVTYGRRAL